jgi:hypothetical protein
MGMVKWLYGYGLPAESLGLVAREVSAELLRMDRPHVTEALRRVALRLRNLRTRVRS